MKQYTDAELADIIEDEGLEYAILDYVSLEWIADETTRKMFEDADVLLNKIKRRLYAARAAEES